MFIVSLVLYSTLTFLLVSLSYSSFFDVYHSYLHIVLYLLLLLATNSFLSPTLLSSTSLHILLLVYHNITELSPLLILYLSVLSPLLPVTSLFIVLFRSLLYLLLVLLFVMTLGWAQVATKAKT